MTRDEFQVRYQSYQETDRGRALAEAGRVNAQADGFRVVVVHFPGLGFVLMLEQAARYVSELFPELTPDPPP